MKLHDTIAGMRRACTAARFTAGPNGRLGLVPTMGALHEGHLSLVRAARRQCNIVAVSIFVNPTQFGPHEDFTRYPRTFETDQALLQKEGVDLLFAPSSDEMYPPGAPEAFVEVPEVGARLDGQHRPGHFRGVATVVAKLFHIVQPDFAFFGQKDAAQVAVLRSMVRALDFPLELIVCPIVRDHDGLALSSRNRYLSSAERLQALAIPNALEDVHRQMSAHPDSTTAQVRHLLRQHLEQQSGLQLEYAEVVHPDTLLPVDSLADGALVAVAARVGGTRLIDNLLLPPQSLATASPATILEHVTV